jgi:hypothetical protein
MKHFLLLLFLISQFNLHSQSHSYTYEASEEYPYGLPNPDAPPQIKDWDDLIGECDCKSVKRLADGTWADSVNMVWRFKYILNGYGVQDDTFKEDGIHSGSIRQFNPDSTRWYVYYYTTASVPSTLPTWEGNKINNNTIILYKDQPAPNGMAGSYKISFTAISHTGFNWTGEWVNQDESIIYPTWQIFCKKKAN